MIYCKKSENIPVSLSSQKKYDGDDVYKQLVTDFHNTCYICEQDNLSFFEIEHFDPSKDLRFERSNLFLACSYCNKKKSNSVINILNCTIKSDNVDTNISFQIQENTATLQADTKVIVKNIGNSDDEKVNNTVLFLEAIYNGNKKDYKNRHKAKCLRDSVLKNIREFQGKLIQYKHNNAIKECIIHHLQPGNGFTAFKRRIIRDYFPTEFGSYITDNE